MISIISHGNRHKVIETRPTGIVLQLRFKLHSQLVLYQLRASGRSQVMNAEQLVSVTPVLNREKARLPG
jgi:hypothetical protein